MSAPADSTWVVFLASFIIGGWFVGLGGLMSDFKAAIDKAFHSFGEFLCAPNTVRAGFALCLVAALALAFWFSLLQKRALGTIRDDLKKLQITVVKKKGRPYSELVKQKAYIDGQVNRHKSGFGAQLLFGIGVLLFCGFLVPSIAFAEFLSKFDWLSVRGHSLVTDSGTSHVIDHPSILQLTGMIAAQLALGVRNASQSMSAITNYVQFRGTAVTYNPFDPIVAWSVVGYRYFIGAFALTLGSFFVAYVHTRYIFVTDQQAEMTKEIAHAKSGRSAEEPAEPDPVPG